MSDYYSDALEEMHAFYGLDDPTAEEQFRFVEAMKYLIEHTSSWDYPQAFMYNLAIYYRDIREFELEKKYLEMSAALDDSTSKAELGFLWYYGLCGTPDYEKAYRYFAETGTRRCKYMLSDMYHYGQYVHQSNYRSREIIEELFVAVESEHKDPRFVISTLYPEIALRLARLDIEEGVDTMFDLDCLLDARDILAVRQKERPFWGNLKTMRSILETTVIMTGNDFDFVDLYDLLTYEQKNAIVTFDYEGVENRIDVFTDEGELIYQYDGKWFHGPEDFLEKARIGGARITSVFDMISDIEVTDGEREIR